MQPIRSCERAIALLALGAMLFATAASWHVGGDDIACEAGVAIRHDASAHRVTGATAPSPHAPQHCWLCHWTRWITAIPASTPGFRIPAVDVATVKPAIDVPPDAARTGLTPGRAPPA